MQLSKGYFLLITILLGLGNGYDTKNSRNKRTLIFIPPGGVIQMVMGVGLPLVLNQESLIVGMVLKGGFILPYNSSHFINPSNTYAKKKRSLSRWDVYEIITQFSRLFGLGGKECVLRTICELSKIPIDKHFGILEELVHVIFTPSTTEEPLENYVDNIYHAAEQIGKTQTLHVNCSFLNASKVIPKYLQDCFHFHFMIWLLLECYRNNLVNCLRK